MNYIHPVYFWEFLSSFFCPLCSGPVSKISFDDNFSFQLGSDGITISCEEIYYKPRLNETDKFEVFDYSRKKIEYFLGYNFPVQKFMNVKTRESKSFWMELVCKKCLKYSLGVTLDFNCDKINPEIIANIGDQQISFKDYNIKNYPENQNYSIVIPKDRLIEDGLMRPVRINYIDFNQPEDDILNEIKVNLAFM